ncbi:MAG TPA: electron transporter RnfG, partial [Halanaerobiales bacterium]|nr:electron transporter RnfG [Halanaerobiales bacterium]
MNKNIGKLVMTLTIIGIISALSLAFVYEWTTPYIEKHAAKARESGIFEVVPEAESYEEVTKNG